MLGGGEGHLLINGAGSVNKYPRGDALVKFN